MREMEPHEIYNKLEEVWKFAALQKMCLELITSGVQSPNPDAWTYPMQEKAWGKVLKEMRIALDELEKLGKAGTP